MRENIFLDDTELLSGWRKMPTGAVIAAASWHELAEGALKHAYSTLKDNVSLSGSLAWGTAEYEGEREDVPRILHWAACKGIAFTSKDDNFKSRMESMASIVTRIMLQACKGEVVLHLVDTLGLGESFANIPTDFPAERLTSSDEREIEGLFEKLRNYIKENPVNGTEWRFAQDNWNPRSQPLHLVCISDVDELSDKCQEMLEELISGCVAARHGIYFFLSCQQDIPIKLSFVPKGGVYENLPVAPTLAWDKERASSVNDYECAKGVFGNKNKNRAHRVEKITYLSFLDELFGEESESEHINEIRLQRRNAYKYYKEGMSAEKTPLPSTAFLGAIFGAVPYSDELASISEIYRRHCSGELEDDISKPWSADSSKGIRAIMGTTPEGRPQYFELGVGKAHSAYHAIIGGDTGSGKSVLINEIVCSLAERYAPDELQFLLLDYKEGTEFAPYRKLPHVRALSIGSNPEFGLEVLKDIAQELTSRGNLFKEAGNARNLEEYRRNSGKKLCRYLLIADEFQVLLNDKAYGEEARTVLTDLVRRGRSFGFNAVLSTQTLQDGALSSEAKNEFACRICLQLAEQKCNLFLASDNVEPCRFTQKGEALVNYNQGQKSGNIFFCSGNKAFPAGFRQTSDILALGEKLAADAKAKGLDGHPRYIYEADGYAEVATVDATQGILLGVRSDMKSTPFYIPERITKGNMLFVGRETAKNRLVEQTLLKQLGGAVKRYTPAEFLDNPAELTPYTMLVAGEGDYDLEEAIAAWLEDCKKAEQEPSQESAATVASVGAPIPAFKAPAGMEDDFADLMSSLNSANAALSPIGGSAPVEPRAGRGRRGRRSGSAHSLILIVESPNDRRTIENAGLRFSDFRLVGYTDSYSYNTLAGNYEKAEIPAAFMYVEMPRGVFSKVRLLNPDKI